MNTTLTNDLCNEVRDLREQLAEAHGELAKGAVLMQEFIMQSARREVILVAVLDAGRPHSHLCECDQCAAYEAVRKELRSE